VTLAIIPRAVLIGVLCCLLSVCREEPLPALWQDDAHTGHNLQPFIDLDYRLSVKARASAQDSLREYLAHMAHEVDFSVLAGIPNHDASWPLLLYVCVHLADVRPQQSTDYVVALVGTQPAFLEVADMFDDTSPAVFNASFPPALRTKMRACLGGPRPTAHD
jgi:hypothetical protein